MGIGHTYIYPNRHSTHTHTYTTVIVNTATGAYNSYNSRMQSLIYIRLNSIANTSDIDIIMVFTPIR